MKQNPYKYTGALDPTDEKDRIVCLPRAKDVEQVINGIMGEYYWGIFGSRQSGKTTFLNLLKSTSLNVHFIYFNFESSPEDEKGFYQMLIDQTIKGILPDQTNPESFVDDEKNYGPALRFFNFLENFKPEDDKIIVFLFDEIAGIPSDSLITFLRTWRKVYTERLHKKELKRYRIVLTGSVDLIAQTTGPTSPFNIPKTLYLKDFSDEESANLIDKPLKKLAIDIEPAAKKYLISQISGHPQLLQYACHMLIEKTNESNETITKQDVDDAIDRLFIENSNLKTLKQDIKTNEELRNLLNDILKGKKIKFHPVSDFSLLGAGAIKEVDSFCEIRNEVYREFIKDILKEEEHLQKKKFPKKKTKQRIWAGIVTGLSVISAIISIATAAPTAFITTGILLIVLLPFIFLIFIQKSED